MSPKQHLMDEIEQSGFFPQLLRRLVADAILEQELVASLLQTETTFEFESIRRHLTILCLLPQTLVIVHVDDQEGRAAASVEYVPLKQIKNFSVQYGIANPSTPVGGTVDELTLQLTWGAVQRAETDVVTCPDPHCQNEHGWTTTILADDLALRVSATAEGQLALAEAETFVAKLRQLLFATTAV